ncbi:MAG TPA: homoserine kinase [Pseudomonadales bacterium]|nr:homoserine kinase [Pseudomonadales bacterium]
MAFYTALLEHEVEDLCNRFGLGPLASCIGASDGIENSTYFLITDSSKYVLTLFEDISMSELPFFVGLMQWLDSRGLPVACPVRDRNGQVLQMLSGKPALLFPCLPGCHPSPVTLFQCEAIGSCLGKIHAGTYAYPERRDNPRGTGWMLDARLRLAGLMDAADLLLLDGQIENARLLRSQGLPLGVIHGDLFHDNALFVGNELTGVIDFYNACTDLLLLDLAVVVNDWCGKPDGSLNKSLVDAVVAAYEVERPLCLAEKQAWQATLQLAASRFWLSRLLAEKLPASHGVIHAHKPSAEYKSRLMYHLTHKIAINENQS